MPAPRVMKHFLNILVHRFSGQLHQLHVGGDGRSGYLQPLLRRHLHHVLHQSQVSPVFFLPQKRFFLRLFLVYTGPPPWHCLIPPSFTGVGRFKKSYLFDTRFFPRRGDVPEELEPSLLEVGQDRQHYGSVTARESFFYLVLESNPMDSESRGNDFSFDSCLSRKWLRGRLYLGWSVS